MRRIRPELKLKFLSKLGLNLTQKPGSVYSFKARYSLFLYSRHICNSSTTGQSFATILLLSDDCKDLQLGCITKNHI